MSDKKIILDNHYSRQSFFAKHLWDSVETRPVMVGEVRFFDNRLMRAYLVSKKQRFFLRSVWEVTWTPVRTEVPISKPEPYPQH